MPVTKGRSLLHAWTVRYLLILVSSLIIVGILTAYLIQVDVKRDQLSGMQQMVHDLAVAVDKGEVPREAMIGQWLDDLADEHRLFARSVMIELDRDGNIVRQFPAHLPIETDHLNDRQHEIFSGESDMFKLDAHNNRPAYLVAYHPLKNASGYVLLLMPEEESASRFIYFNTSRIIIACIIVLAGWGVVYMLTRRLSRSIGTAVAAARQIVSGDYNVEITAEYREREIYELMSSFKEMAERLNRLESLRTQFLAGVTHELRTPVTSISALLQAVKEGVVHEREADEFLTICLKECQRLEKMIEDLLDFNSFAASTVTIGREECNLYKLLLDISERWQYGEDKTNVRVLVEAVENEMDWHVITDSHRVEQIVVNLLNNAKDAIGNSGVIIIELSFDSSHYYIQVKDEGHGIPSCEQVNIFEPFYRGERKKAKVRGLGLGLPYSRLIARSLGGELLLADSSSAGTTFTLLLPRKLEKIADKVL